ncbi:vesicle-associated membrane protein 8 isoform X2 [Mugil cephalus]|uniref:vesicle-associated membrane protein 8 isoform X2 n=1 Tax=Mugil cephalus TaxID=48193 RepID=UPI001FB813E7|nr:vesicle-associated membrane protein 8 isoform X2 [Mugil cephalus]
MVASRGSENKGEKDKCVDAAHTESGAGSSDVESALGKEEQRTTIQSLSGDVEEVEKIMKRTIQQAMDRGESLIKFEKKAEEMEQAGKMFQVTGERVARSYWWKNVKLVVVIIVVVVIIILIIVLLATGVIPVSAPVPPITPITTTKAP